MIFNELTEDNYLMFAIKNYDNPQSVTYDDFEEDMKRFKYVKRLLKKYSKSKVLRTHLILNHLIILFNVFGESTTPLLMFKTEHEHWSCIKTFLTFLNRWPEGFMQDLQLDTNIEEQLKSI